MGNTTPPLVAEEEPSARLAPLWFGRAASRSVRWLSPPREPLLVRLSPLGRDRTTLLPLRATCRLLSCASSVYPLSAPRMCFTTPMSLFGLACFVLSSYFTSPPVLTLDMSALGG